MSIKQDFTILTKNDSHKVCQTSPAPPQKLARYQVREFLTDSKIRVAEPRTKKALMAAPFRVGADPVPSSGTCFNWVSVNVEEDLVSILEVCNQKINLAKGPKTT